MRQHFTSEEEFEDTYNYPHGLYDYVKSISGENRWWFKEAYRMDDGSYFIIYSSYVTHEYRNFILSIHAVPVGENYVFSIQKQVTDMA